MTESKLEYMDKAISIAHSCLKNPRRHPFGAIIVKNNKIVGIGMEATRIKNDPTAHSEMEAIRNACENLMTDSLQGCIMYTSSEPCSMCLSALFWSQIDTVYYACSREDVFEFGFSDRFKLVEKRRNPVQSNFKEIKLLQINNPKAIQVFKDWKLNKRTLQPL